jgi:hypothetical protein
LTLRSRVDEAMRHAPIVDLHTHLFAPEFGELNLWGIDELLTYHYLVAETLRAEPERYFSLCKSDQADLVWDALFVRRTPLSEATAGVVTVLSSFGLNPAPPDLREARAFYASRQTPFHLDDVLARTNVSHVVMTNDPLDPAERTYWDRCIKPNPRFKGVLRIDPLLDNWPAAASKLAADGYQTDPELNDRSLAEARRYLDAWIKRLEACYMAASFPNTFAYPEDSNRAKLLRQVVLPACRDHGIPFAMMIGVRRAVNPRLKAAGDGFGVADMGAVEHLAGEFADNRFLVTTLARENAYGLCVAARKFANILPFGCWWFMNNPSLVEDTTLMRLEMLGPTFVPQHSDARILDQLIYKWAHAKRAIGAALTTRYEALETTTRRITQAETDRDVRALMGGIAAEWLGFKA